MKKVKIINYVQIFITIAVLVFLLSFEFNFRILFTAINSIFISLFFCELRYGKATNKELCKLKKIKK